MRNVDCCKDCYDRHPLCHADCPKKAKADEVWNTLREERRKNSDVLGFAKDSKTKRIRRKNIK